MPVVSTRSPKLLHEDNVAVVRNSHSRIFVTVVVDGVRRALQAIRTVSLFF